MRQLYSTRLLCVEYDSLLLKWGCSLRHVWSVQARSILSIPEHLATDSKRIRHTPLEMIEMAQNFQDCRWCIENEPEWSEHAKCWIHRRDSIDKRCLNPEFHEWWKSVGENVEGGPTEAQVFYAGRASRDAEVADWKKAIKGLTPSGSEFVDDPAACAAFIRERTNVPQIVIDLRKQNANLQSRIDRVKALAEDRKANQRNIQADELLRALEGR